MNSALDLENHYSGKKVLVTGHTGFKGTWLSMILRQLGAKVIGYSLPPAAEPNLFKLTRLSEEIEHIEGDIRDYGKLKSVLDEHQPDFVFHLAAQAIVLDGYTQPKETFDVNAGGTVNLLEALRYSPSVKGCLIITTDKCYANKHWIWGYRETDPLGGKDPYSASKSMAELATDAYRSSFFGKQHGRSLLVASVRAGNIIGGGDFSDFRIIPDCMRALSQDSSIEVRNPQSARPWLYVLDALSGYLQLGCHLLQGDESKADAWNFGPLENRAVTVKDIVEKTIEIWGCGSWKDLSEGPKKAEMPMLRLNWDKAANQLNWHPLFDWQKALEASVHWYQAFFSGQDMRQFCLKQINTHRSPRNVSNEIYAHTS